MLLLKNGTIKTMAGPDLANADLLIGDDGKIAAVGQDLTCPEGAAIVRLDGALVSPGLVEAHCHVGLAEEINGAAGNDTNECSEPITPEMRGIDGFNPQDPGVAAALRAGVTTACAGPGSANVIGGTFDVYKLTGVSADEMCIRRDMAMKVALGENPKNCFGSMKKAPYTRMGIAALLRTTLRRTQLYVEQKAHARETGAPQPYDPKLEAMIPVIEGRIPLKVHAHRADDILTAIRIAREFGLRLTLDHCSDGHLIIPQLLDFGAPALVGPTMMRKTKFESTNKDFTTPARLTAAGVKVAIITDAPIIPLYCLPICAGMAVDGGLPEQEAWKAVTINPAEILGVADRVGSLEPGKDADVVVWRGNPITGVHYRAALVIVDGKVVYRDQEA